MSTVTNLLNEKLIINVFYFISLIYNKYNKNLKLEK